MVSRNLRVLGSDGGVGLGGCPFKFSLRLSFSILLLASLILMFDSLLSTSMSFSLCSLFGSDHGNQLDASKYGTQPCSSSRLLCDPYFRHFLEIFEGFEMRWRSSSLQSESRDKGNRPIQVLDGEVRPKTMTNSPCTQRSVQANEENTKR